MVHPFSIVETLKVSWKVLKKNFVTLFIYCIITLVVYGFLKFLPIVLLLSDSKLTQLILFLVQLVIQSYLTLSFYKLILTLMDKEYYEFEFKQIWPSLKMALSFIAIVVAYGLLLVIIFLINKTMQAYDGILLILQVVEMIFILFLLIRSIFCICFIADEDSNPYESLKQSFYITRGNFFNTLFIGIIIIAIMIATLIPIISLVSVFGANKDNIEFLFEVSFCLWFVIAFPMVQVIIMVTYRKLIYSHLDVDDDITETL
jgi:hypothetical protein